MKRLINKLILKLYRAGSILEVNAKLNAVRQHPHVQIAEAVYPGPFFAIYLETGNCQLIIGDQFYTRSFCNIRVGDAGVLTIQKNVFFNNYCSVNCMYSIEIGENVMFGEGVKIYDHNHVITKNETVNIHRNELDYGKVVIGKNSWLGSNVTVLKGVTIGENVVIGANCLIYKDIPANSIVKNAAGLDRITIE